jgi:DNA-binding response OmpR family regulator
VVADVATRGEDALWMAGATEFDAVVLDLRLPGIDGFETCRRLRDDGVWTPIIMLTARDAIEDRVQGLDQGADDYLTKPFSLAVGLWSAPQCSRSATCVWIPRRARLGGVSRRSSFLQK